MTDSVTPEPSAEARAAAREICAVLALQMKRADKEAALAPALDAYAAARVAEERERWALLNPPPLACPPDCPLHHRHGGCEYVRAPSGGSA